MAVSVIEDPAVLDVLPHDDDVGRAVPEGWTGQPGGRLAVIGDLDFATNLHVIAGNNRDLFLNSIAWLVEEEDQIGERPEAGETLEITELESGVLCLLVGFLLPGASAALGMGVLFRRRRL